MVQRAVLRWDNVNERGGPVRSARARLAGGHQGGRADLTVDGAITREAPVVNDRIVAPPRLGSCSRSDSSTASPPRLGRCSRGSGCSCVCGRVGGKVERWRISCGRGRRSGGSGGACVECVTLSSGKSGGNSTKSRCLGVQSVGLIEVGCGVTVERVDVSEQGIRCRPRLHGGVSVFHGDGIGRSGICLGPKSGDGSSLGILHRL